MNQTEHTARTHAEYDYDQGDAMSREHQTTASHPQYLPAVNQTMITVYIDGRLDVRHGENIVVTVKESR